MSTRKLLSPVVRNELLLRKQCANTPTLPAPGCRGYICPMWATNNGYFDESGFQIDYVEGTYEFLNLQVLCPCCHAVKTKRNSTSDETNGKRKRRNSE